MALTQADIQQVLNAIKADSQGIENLPVATSLNGIKSLPATKGTEVVSVPISLLGAVAETATAGANTAKDAANTAASGANAAKTGAIQATQDANSAAQAAQEAAELENQAAQGSIRKVTLQDKDGNTKSELTPDVHGNINLLEDGGGSGSGFYNVTQLHPLADGYYTKATAVAAMATADIDADSKPAMIITFEVSAGSWIDYRFESTSIANFAEPSAWKRYGGGDAIKKVTINSGTSSESYEADENGDITIPIEKIVVDPTLDENSTNPVQNKALTAALKELSGKYGASLQLNVIGEGADKAYSISILDENGNVLSTTDMFTGVAEVVQWQLPRYN